jgi:hypothetical protein
MTTQNTITGQASSEPSVIDVTPLVEHGNSPTAIIRTLAIFTSVLLGSIAKLGGR